MIYHCKRGPLWALVNRSDEARTALRRIMCLPLCRADSIPALVERLRRYIFEHHVPEMEALLNAFNTNFVEAYGAEAVSVFGQAQRTTNSVENAHRQLGRRIGQKRPNFHDFLGKYKLHCSKKINGVLSRAKHKS